jgi:hypothetical protein
VNSNFKENSLIITWAFSCASLRCDFDSKNYDRLINSFHVENFLQLYLRWSYSRMETQMSSPAMPRNCILILGCLFVSHAFAQDLSGLSSSELQRQQQREDAQRRQDEARPDVRLQPASAAPVSAYPPETPCFVIRTVKRRWWGRGRSLDCEYFFWARGETEYCTYGRKSE